MNVLPLHKTPELRSDRVLPPEQPECEMAVLGAIMFDRDFLPLAEDRLKPHLFASEGHRLVFEAMLVIRDENSPLSLVSVAAKLKRRSQLEKIGGKSALLRMVDSCVHSRVALDYIEILEDSWMRREAMRLGGQLIRSAHDSAPIVESLSQSVTAISEIGTVTSGSAVHVADAGISAIEAMMANAERGDGMLGPSSGFYDVDAALRGFRAGHLNILAARPGMGKTSIALQIADYIASAGHPALFISLEMTKEELYFKLLSLKSGIAATAIESGQVTNFDTIYQASNEINNKPLYLFDADCGYSSIEAIARDVRRQCGGKLGAIFIDYLQLLDCPGANRVEALSKLTRSLKKLAVKLNCNITALSQLSRNLEGRQNKRPMLSDLRESGSLEQDANAVAFLYRDDYYNPESPDKGICEFIISKNRSGPNKTIKLLFEPHCTRFKNWAGR